MHTPIRPFFGIGKIYFTSKLFILENPISFFKLQGTTSGTKTVYLNNTLKIVVINVLTNRLS